jgi:hypothetical protein
MIAFIITKKTDDTFEYVGDGMSFPDGVTTVHWHNKQNDTWNSLKEARTDIEHDGHTIDIYGSYGILEHTDTLIYQVHLPDKCAGTHCPIHNRSDHAMRAFPQYWRADRIIMERTCPCGIGHPDPDSPWPDGDANWIHGCCGIHCAGAIK